MSPVVVLLAFLLLGLYSAAPVLMGLVLGGVVGGLLGKGSRGLGTGALWGAVLGIIGFAWGWLVAPG